MRSDWKTWEDAREDLRAMGHPTWWDGILVGVTDEKLEELRACWHFHCEMERRKRHGPTRRRFD